MRKVKLLALLLAALMVVTAFAGCADTKEIESDVANLDERVTALEGKVDSALSGIDEVKDAVEDSKADEELKAIQQALEDQKTANQALLDQIKQLQDDLKDANNRIDSSVASGADLTNAKATAVATIAASRVVYDNNKNDYTAEDYAAIVKALEVATANINSAKTQADIDAALKTMQETLKAYTAYDDQLYLYVTKLYGNITDETEELVEEALECLKEAKEHYSLITNGAKAYTEYVYGVDEDGNALKIDLEDTLDKIDDLQNANTIVTFKASTADIVGNGVEEDVDIYSLAYAKAEAKALDRAIEDKLEEGVTLSTTDLDELADQYEAWVKGVTPLGKANLDLLTYADELNDALDTIVSLAEAKAAFAKLGKFNQTSKTWDSIFAPYDELVEDDANRVISSDGKTADVQAIYAKIDKAIADWQSKYDLSDENAIDIINEAYSNKYYDEDADANDTATYCSNRDYVDLMMDAYASFKKDVIPAVEAVNGVKTLSTSAFETYKDLQDLLEDWMVVVEADKTAKPAVKEVKVDIDNLELMIMLTEVKEDYKAGDYAAEGCLALVTFAQDVKNKNTEFYDFFDVTYAAAEEYAEEINEAIADLVEDSDELLSIKQILALEYAYAPLKDDASKYVEVVVTAKEVTSEDGASTTLVLEYTNEDYDVMAAEGKTVAGFNAIYVTDDYDLSVLLDTDELETLKKDTIKKIADFKADAVKIASLVDAVDAVVVNVDADGDYVKYDEDSSLDVMHLVTLADKTSVKAAQDAYNAWVKAGATSAMREFVEAKDADGKVIDGVYTFDTIIDADAVNVLVSMNNQIVALDDLATVITNYYKYTKQAVDYGKNKLTTSNLGKTAITSYSKTVNEYTDKVTETTKGVMKDVTLKVDSSLYSVKIGTAGTLLTYDVLLKNVHALYDMFMELNAEWYYEDDGELCDEPKAETYAKVEDAKATNAAYDLIFVKSYAKSNLKSLKDSSTATYTVAEINTFINNWMSEVEAAETYAEINNIMKEVNFKTGFAIKSVYVGNTEVIKAIPAAN